MSLAATGEFALISKVTARLPPAPSTLVGPGDDAALVAVPDGRVVATCDVLVEGRHFRTDWASARDIGRRAAAANLADVAAMGAVTTSLLVGLCVPPDLDVRWVEQLADGIGAECGLVGAGVIGGDISASPLIVIAVTALGDLAGRAPVLRSGARPGDVVALAGRVGAAAAGYAVLSRGFRSPKALVEAYRRPAVPYGAGPAAAALGATSMIDISDGLLADLGHVARASGVGIDVTKGVFEVSPPMRDAAAALGVDPYTWIFTGGDDHALAATFPAGTELPEEWLVIGQVTAGGEAGAGGGVAAGGRASTGGSAATGAGVTVDGRPYLDSPLGWDHFR